MRPLTLLLHKSMNWFLYDNGLSHERVKRILRQMQPPEIFYKKGVLKNLGKFTGKKPVYELIF